MRARILVVEASHDVRTLVADVLTSDGHQVKGVSSGVKALALLERSEYDLILSDLTMPHMDGAALYWEITRRWPPLTSRIICLASQGYSSRDHEALLAASVPIVPKPFRPATLLEVVRQRLAERFPAPPPTPP